jgi:hypothetical protein
MGRSRRRRRGRSRLAGARSDGQRKRREQLRVSGAASAFYLEHPELRRKTAGRGEAAAPAASGEDAVARHDDGHGVPAERPADGLGCAGRPDLRRQLAVAQNLPARDSPRGLVDAAVESRHGRQIDLDFEQVRAAALEQLDDEADGRRGRVGRLRLLRIPEPAAKVAA